MKKEIKSNHFDTVETDIWDVKTENVISSYWFTIREGKKLLKHLGYELNEERAEFAGKLLYDFAATLKALVKEEMLEEMRKGIKNIETFYK